MKRLIVILGLIGGGYIFVYSSHNQQRISEANKKAEIASTPIPRPILGVPLEIVAHIDGESTLIITKDELHWLHRNGVKPGSWMPQGSTDLKRNGTQINGQIWLPRWTHPAPDVADTSTIYPLKLKSLSYKIETTSGGASIKYAQDGNSISILFSDPSPGPHFHTVRLIPQPATEEEVSALHNNKPRLAPDGYAFLVARISLSSADGITAMNPGTPVKVIEENGEKLVVAVGETKFEVSQNQITNDVDAAGYLAASISEAEAGRSVLAKQQVSEAESQELARQKEAIKQREIVEKQSSGSASVATVREGNPLNRKAYGQTQKRFAGLARRTPYSQQIYTLTARINDIERPLLYEQVKSLSENSKAELQRLKAQLDTLQQLENIYLGIK